MSTFRSEIDNSSLVPVPQNGPKSQLSILNTRHLGTSYAHSHPGPIKVSLKGQPMGVGFLQKWKPEELQKMQENTKIQGSMKGFSRDNNSLWEGFLPQQYYIRNNLFLPKGHITLCVGFAFWSDLSPKRDQNATKTRPKRDQNATKKRPKSDQKATKKRPKRN